MRCAVLRTAGDYAQGTGCPDDVCVGNGHAGEKPITYSPWPAPRRGTAAVTRVTCPSFPFLARWIRPGSCAAACARGWKPFAVAIVAGAAAVLHGAHSAATWQRSGWAAMQRPDSLAALSGLVYFRGRTQFPAQQARADRAAGTPDRRDRRHRRGPTGKRSWAATSSTSANAGRRCSAWTCDPAEPLSVEQWRSLVHPDDLPKVDIGHRRMLPRTVTTSTSWISGCAMPMATGSG